MITRGSPEALPRVDASETGKYSELQKDLQEDFEKFVRDNPPITEPVGNPKEILKSPLPRSSSGLMTDCLNSEDRWRGVPCTLSGRLCLTMISLRRSC